MAHKGGNEVKGGFFWKKGDWEIVTVEGRRGRLPGTEEAEYLRIPALLFIPVALTLGAAYVIFLPFIGFAMLAKVIVQKLRAMPRRAHGPAANDLAPGHKSSR